MNEKDVNQEQNKKLLFAIVTNASDLKNDIKKVLSKT